MGERLNPSFLPSYGISDIVNSIILNMGELSVRTFTLRLLSIFSVFVWSPMQAMQQQLLPATRSPMRISFVRPPMQAVRQRQFPLLPPQEGSVLFRTGTYLYAVEPAVLKQLEGLVSLHAMKQLGTGDNKQTNIHKLTLVDSATFDTVLTCLRASLGDGNYSQRVANVAKILQHTTAKQANNILHALDFLNAKPGPFSTALLLRYAAVNPKVASHLGKSYDELPQNIREVMSRGAYDRLNSMLHHALMKPHFTRQNPPRWLPPFARETFQSESPRTPDEIKSLLRKHDNWRFLAYLPGKANLQELYLSDEELTSLPPEIGHLIGLKRLWLHNNQLRSLPPSIGGMVNLLSLDLTHNKLTSLPTSVGGLTSLQYLLLEHNQLTSLPPDIGRLTGLMHLWLAGNQLTSLPPSIGGMVNLQKLDLDNNGLTSLPASIGGLTGLMHLWLAGNQLTSLPPSIGGLAGLRTLCLYDNKLTSLPPEIGRLIGLRELRLSENKLTSLLPSIGGMTALMLLWLDENQLTSLPPSIGGMTRLQGLWLDDNQLTSLRLSIDRLNLRKLLLSRNKLTRD